MMFAPWMRLRQLSMSMPAWVRPSAYLWHRLALVGVLSLAAFLRLFRLDHEEFNEYYASVVLSMLSSWYNFFFASFDPGGFVTVEKPPVGFWFQTGSAWVLGWNPLGLLLPQALAGLLSVVVLYHLVRRVFGPVAGLLAAAMLAITPISVATNRNNTVDSLLVCTLLLAAWAVTRAAETGRLRYLLLGSSLVGLGVNIKLLQAVQVLPAFYLLYLVAAPLSWWRRLVHLTLATGILGVVALAWVVAVDLTPPAQRPYIGGSYNNTARQMLIGTASQRMLEGRRLLLGSSSPRPVVSSAPSPRRLAEIGNPGPFRLINHQLAGQLSWVLPLAGLGTLVAIWQQRLRASRNPALLALLLWGMWLVPQALLYSFIPKFHRYYLEMLAPANAALFGIGVLALWQAYRRGGWQVWLLPLAFVLNASLEVYILAAYPHWSRWLILPIAGLCLASVGVLVSMQLWRRTMSHWTHRATGVGVLALLLAPLSWAATPIWGDGAAIYPFAGPELVTTQRSTLAEPDLHPLIDYLQANRKGERFLVATLRAQTATPLILLTGEPVMALKGNSGVDRIVTAEQLAERVQHGEVRFFLLPDRQHAAKLPEQQGRDVIRWVHAQCRLVAAEAWQAARDGPQGPFPNDPQQLFDCATFRQ